jgi:HEXXH motif-containing protein
MSASEFEYQELLPPWSVSFPARLAEFLERRVLIPKGLSSRRYSTADFLQPAKAKPRIGELGPTWAERVEFLSPNDCTRFEGVGLRFPMDHEAELSQVASLFRDVSALMAVDASLQASVESLVKAVHILKSNGPGYDSSFSDPGIPFSIFISIPDSPERNRELRVFEAIVHECMHLQLTAFELLVPIIQSEGADARYYSPWKKSLRKVQGVLHGMYVFHVVAHAYSVLIRSRTLIPSERAFARRRLQEISNELIEVRGVETSSDLTPAGVALAQAIWKQHAALA